MSYPASPSYQVDFPEFGYNVTPSDTVSGPCPFKMIYCGGSGSIAYVDMGNNVVTLAGCLVGYQYWICGKRINATGTTATNIVALV